MRVTPLLSCCALSFAVAAPALAQDAMASHDMMTSKMSAAEMKTMKACHAMLPAKAAKNAGCKKMMAMHPDMMKHDDMMKKGG